jgi:hypothetical protein
MTKYLLLIKIAFALILLVNCQPRSKNQEEIKELLLSEYHDYKSMKILLQEFHQNYPKITKFYSIGKSVEQRDLLVFQISDNVDRIEPGEPAFKYIGNCKEYT